ncbi:energy transducer TonB [Neisseria weixii]|uniref:Energy transducer TonB n=1 Tax=Neisseria weixii TaxID=1853276 RepID=A0A3N4MJ92_9NEIS|nr:energy transducer TonB [Neisseria weixii]RPD83078.1 energy transducer TonB [Neisseria weixii]RPD83115.1 energy transducer TonB [Neisseria weixii]
MKCDRIILLIIIAGLVGYILNIKSEIKKQDHELINTKVRALYIKEARYPEIAMENEVEGTVRIKATIDNFGYPKEVEIAESSGNFSLDIAAKKALKSSIFIPEIQNGKIKETVITMPYRFDLDGV